MSFGIVLPSTAESHECTAKDSELACNMALKHTIAILDRPEPAICFSSQKILPKS
jgi:hypothetical protein